MAFCDNSHKESTQCLKRLPLEHQEQHSNSWLPAIISTDGLIYFWALDHHDHDHHRHHHPWALDLRGERGNDEGRGSSDGCCLPPIKQTSPTSALVQGREVLGSYTAPVYQTNLSHLYSGMWKYLKDCPHQTYTPPTSLVVVPLKYLKYLQTLPSYQTYTRGNPPLLLLYLNTVPHQTNLCSCTLLEGTWRYFTVLTST